MVQKRHQFRHPQGNREIYVRSQLRAGLSGGEKGNAAGAKAIAVSGVDHTHLRCTCQAGPGGRKHCIILLYSSGSQEKKFHGLHNPYPVSRVARE